MARRTALDRLRELCLALPETSERVFGGHTNPTFRVGKKIFVTVEPHDGRPNTAFWCKAPAGAQEVLVRGDPVRYFVPPYVGRNGWVGVRLTGDVDWPFVASLVEDSYRMTAPKRMLAALEARSTK
jgi:hypothetical protein